MRKQILDFSLYNTAAQGWLDLEQLTQVQVTSQQAEYPIELALIPARDELVTIGSGWLAAQSGEQTIRRVFDKPQNIEQIHLLFRENDHQRTQEFLLRYSTDHGASYHHILRQQYSFSPPSTPTQREDYKVQLQAVTTLELSIIPDISGRSCRASLESLRLA